MTSTQLDWTNDGAASPVPAAGAAPGARWDGPNARARIALLVNVFLLVWVIGSALDVADSAWVFSGSRALTIPSLVVSGFFWVLLLPAFLLGVGYSPWLPRRSLGRLLGAGIVVGFSTDPFFSVTPEPEESGLMPLLRSWIYWPVEDALVLYFSQSLQLVIGIAGYWMLRRQCGVSGYYLDAQSLAAAEKPFRNEARAGAGAVSWRLWDGPHARARIAVFFNAFLLVWVVGATLGAANSALVLATESRVLGPLSFATGVFSWTLLPPFLLVMGLSPWLPRRTLGWLLAAVLVVAVFFNLFNLGVTDPDAELTLASVIYWPIAEAPYMLFFELLELMIAFSGYWMLRRQCGVSGYYLDAHSLAAAKKPFRNEARVGAGAASWRLWDEPHARVRIAVFINAFLLVWVVGATLGVADSTLVLATESRVLGPLSFATGVFSWTLLPPFLLVMSLSPWLPRRTLGWLLVAGLAVGFSVLPFLSETDPGAELTLASAIYWPIADARPMLFSQFLQLVIVVAGYWVLRRQCGISGYYLDAQSLATAEKPGRTFLEVLADTRQGYLAYLGKAFVIDMVPTFVLIAVFVLPIMFFDPFPPAEMPTADAVESFEAVFEAVWLILLAPIYETLLLWVALVVVRWAIGDRPLATAAWVGLLCGLAHLTNSVLNFVVFWGFFVQALAFMAWEKHSWWKAFAMVATLHALYNAFLFPVIAGAGQ